MARLSNSVVNKSNGLQELAKVLEKQQKNLGTTTSQKSVKKVPSKPKVEATQVLTTINVASATAPMLDISDDEIKSIDEAQRVFGKGFTPDEYAKMRDVYNTYLPSYPLKTANHKMALIKVCKCTMRYDQALADNDLEAMKSWDGALSKALKEAKINPEQLNSADLTEGITSVSQLVMAVEKVREPIGILPHLLSNPQDGADYIIWQIVNYLLGMKNMPLCKYADLYRFLDEQYEQNKDSLPFLVRNVNGNYDSETSDGL